MNRPARLSNEIEPTPCFLPPAIERFKSEQISKSQCHIGLEDFTVKIKSTRHEERFQRLETFRSIERFFCVKNKADR